MPRPSKKVGNYTKSEIQQFTFQEPKQQEFYLARLAGNEWRPLAESIAMLETLIQVSLDRGEALSVSKLSSQLAALKKQQDRLMIENHLVIPIDCVDTLVNTWAGVIGKHMVEYMAGGPLKIQGKDDDYVPTPDGFFKAFDAMAGEVATVTTEIIDDYINEARKTGPRQAGRKVGS